MGRPTAALLWEIWRQHQRTIAVIAGLTLAGRLFDFFEEGARTPATGVDSSPPVAHATGFFMLGLWRGDL